MGWWKIQGTENIIGDIPLDALGDALSTVVAKYQSALGRRPTKLEWEALLKAVFGNEVPEFRVLDEGIVQRVSLDVK
jgi:hypothetical protein